MRREVGTMLGGPVRTASTMPSTWYGSGRVSTVAIRILGGSG
jgi:hypothetical protein